LEHHAVTRTELERIAVIETELGALRADVAEIKRDVKRLILADAAHVGVLGLMTRIVPWVAIAVSAYAVFR
jgi:hypothetical protein